jgi:hypothetical protein
MFLLSSSKIDFLDEFWSDSHALLEFRYIREIDTQVLILGFSLHMST